MNPHTKVFIANSLRFCIIYFDMFPKILFPERFNEQGRPEGGQYYPMS